MNKIYPVFILIIAAISLSSFSQSRKDIESEWALYKSNKVKTKLCKYENYNGKTYYDNEGKPTLLEVYDASGVKINELEYNYDSQNNLIKEAGFIINKKSKIPNKVQ